MYVAERGDDPPSGSGSDIRVLVPREYSSWQERLASAHLCGVVPRWYAAPRLSSCCALYTLGLARIGATATNIPDDVRKTPCACYSCFNALPLRHVPRMPAPDFNCP